MVTYLEYVLSVSTDQGSPKWSRPQAGDIRHAHPSWVLDVVDFISGLALGQTFTSAVGMTAFSASRIPSELPRLLQQDATLAISRHFCEDFPEIAQPCKVRQARSVL
jgi:hypothetical protein